MPAIELDIKRITDAVQGTFGEAIIQATLYRLGNPITSEVKIAPGQRQRPGEVWVHRPGNDPQNAIRVLNIGPGRLPDEKLLYGAFVLVKTQNGLPMITGEAPENSYYTDGAPAAPQRSISAQQLDFGLMKPTDPASMKCLVSGWQYQLNGTIYRVPSLLTADFTANVPSAGLARAVLVELDPVTNTFTNTVGSTFSNTLGHTDAFATYYPKTVNNSRFAVGYVRLQNGQTTIVQDDILPAQELLNKSGSSMGAINCTLSSDYILTSGYSIVVAGPYIIASGITLTISSNAVFQIL